MSPRAMATLKDVYDRFTKQPNSGDLHTSATLSYISSGTNVTGANEILQFILRSKKDVQVTEDVISYYSGHNSLTLEIAAECKFKNGPGWIVPGVEGNLIDQMVVKIPLVKTVVFTGDKIRSIRVYWDQATVLKQLEIVGARGRGWPITDGNNQIELITKTVVFTEAPKPKQEQPVQNGKLEAATASVKSPEKPNVTATPRRTYSITNDIEVDVDEHQRLPRAGWQNHRQHFTLSEEGDLPLKDQSPVRLPRVGKAPRREFSFSNLSEAYKSQDTTASKPKEPTHFEVDDDPEEGNAPVKPSQGGGTGGVPTEIFTPIAEETPKPASRHRAVEHEIIFHDVDSSPRDPVKPSIGGGTGGRRPEETIFFELAEDANPFVQPKKMPVTRRDQQTHFTFTDESPPSTPIPQTKAMSLQHFSIEGTPDPLEAEYRARALQRKEVNHFRPDTVPHFEFVDRSDDEDARKSKKENSEGMNKLLKGIGRSWMVGTDSPSVPKDTHRSGLPKKGLTPHFSFGDSSPAKSEEEKENGRTGRGQTKRMQVPVKAEKEWWET